MVLVGVSIEDGSSDGLFQLHYIALDGSNQTVVANEFALSGVTGKNGNNPIEVNGSFEDLEGVGRLGAKRVYTISESNFGGGIGDPGVIIRNADRAPVARLFNLDGVRTGDDSGLALQKTSDGIVAYNVQGSDEVAPIGSTFYKIDTSNGSKNPPTAVQAGVNLEFNGQNEFADSLAIQRNNSRFALAADLESADGDGRELYTIELSTGQITDVAEIRVFDGSGNKIDLPDSDSGLAIAPGGKELFLLADQTNDVFQFSDPDAARLISRASRLGALPNRVDFTLVADLPEEGTVAGLGEYEGLAVIDIANPF